MLAEGEEPWPQGHRTCVLQRAPWQCTAACGPCLPLSPFQTVNARYRYHMNQLRSFWGPDDCPVHQLLTRPSHAPQCTLDRAVPQGPGGAGQPEEGAH